ncbi:unnamed protein product [Cunninghamella blakesleeana]
MDDLLLLKNICIDTADFYSDIRKMSYKKSITSFTTTPTSSKHLASPIHSSSSTPSSSSSSSTLETNYVWCRDI